MTDITINLKDAITIGYLVIITVGLWLKIRKLRSNDIDDIKKELAGFKETYSQDRIENAREMGKLHACVKNLTEDVSSLNVRFEKHLNQK